MPDEEQTLVSTQQYKLQGLNSSMRTSKITVKVAFKKKIRRLGKAAHSDRIVRAYSLGTCGHTRLGRHVRSNIGRMSEHSSTLAGCM